MSTETVTAVAPVASYSSDEAFYATRYRQGGRTVYLIALTPDQIINNIPRPNPEVKNPGNREIRPRHAREFANYYLTRDNWVIPGVILRSPNIFHFTTDLDVDDQSAQFGTLSYPKRKRGDIQILDGQHRILGFHIATEILEAERQKAYDQLRRAQRTSEKGSKVIRDAEKRIAEIEAKQKRFFAERVAVEVQVTDDPVAYKQMFFDIADNALGITASERVGFDSAKVANRAYALVATHPLLQGRIDEKNNRLGRTSDYLLTARHVAEIIRATNLGINGRFGKVMEQESSEVEVARKTTDYFDMLVRVFPQLKNVEKGILAPSQLRQVSVLGSPLFLRILAGVAHELHEHAWSPKQIEEFFAVIGKHVEVPVHENSIWWTQTPEETFDLGGVGPNARRQDIMNLYGRILDWAILGAEAYPAVYADPLLAPEQPEDPDEGIDFAPDHDTTAVAVEMRNEVEEIASQSKARSKKK